MKQSTFVKRFSFFAAIAILLKLLWDIFLETPYKKIKEMFEAFERIRGGNRKFEESGIPLSASRILSSQYNSLLAVFIYNGNAENPLEVALVGSTTEKPEDAKIPTSIKDAQSRLIDYLDTGIPFGLGDYPLSIGIDKAGLDRLRTLSKKTECRSLLLFSCFEPEFPNNRNVPAERKEHVTFGILASTKYDDRRIHPEHENGLQGEETWPYLSFTWFKDLRQKKEQKQEEQK